jgi:hypothetical protein
VGQITQHSVPNATLVHPVVLPNGGSQPRVCDFDDMVLRLVKWHPSSHGFTSTYSELAASRLGQLIGAPAIRGILVYVHTKLLPRDLSNRVTQPFHVGFTFSPGKNFSDADYTNIQNDAALPAAAVHLAWLQVGDQEGHNQYLYQLEQVLPDRTTRRMNHFILVDQAAVCGSHDWSNAELNPAGPYNLPQHLKSRVKMTSIEPILQHVNALAEETIRSCFESYPDEWNTKPNLVQKIVDFILQRRKHLGDILRANLT